MKRSTVRTQIFRAVTEIQSMSGNPGMTLHGGTRPLKDLHGFDSLNCVEVSTMASGYLGCEIKQDVALFGSSKQPKTMDEIVNQVCIILGAEED